MKKKYVNAVIAIGLAVIMLSGCSSTNGNSNTNNSTNNSSGSSTANGASDTAAAGGGAESYEKVVYAYPSFNNIPESATLDTVEEAINEITREKIGVEVELLPVAISDYAQQVTLSLQGGEQIDVFFPLDGFNNAVAAGMATDLTDLLDEYAAESKALVGESWLKATSKEGRIYGIPAYKPIALTPMVIYKKDITDELGIDMSKVNSIYDLTEVLRRVKEAYPEMTPLVPVNPGDSGMARCMPEVDYLSDSYRSPKGVVIGSDTTVVDYYATEGFRDMCNLTRTWYTEGLIMKDAATTTGASAELMNASNSFCYIATYSYPEEDTAASLEAQTGGYKLGARIIGEAYLNTSSINTVTWMVSSNSKVPESALAFLNLTFTDEDVINLIINGIEGRDYVKNDDGTIRYPDGQDATTVPYTAQLSCGICGNFFIMYQVEGTNPESLEWEIEQNKNAKTSSVMGFSFDSSGVKTEYTSVANVVDQYLPGLSCGSIDPETELPKFIQSLKDAGMDNIISAKQEQLDNWLETR